MEPARVPMHQYYLLEIVFSGTFPNLASEIINTLKQWIRQRNEFHLIKLGDVFYLGPFLSSFHLYACFCVSKHSLQTLVYSPAGDPPVLQKQQDHGVLNERDEHEGDADHEIEINGVQARGYRSLLSTSTYVLYIMSQDFFFLQFSIPHTIENVDKD